MDRKTHVVPELLEVTIRGTIRASVHFTKKSLQCHEGQNRRICTSWKLVRKLQKKSQEDFIEEVKIE